VTEFVRERQSLAPRHPPPRLLMLREGRSLKEPSEVTELLMLVGAQEGARGEPTSRKPRSVTGQLRRPAIRSRTDRVTSSSRRRSQVLAGTLAPTRRTRPLSTPPGRPRMDPTRVEATVHRHSPRIDGRSHLPDAPARGRLSAIGRIASSRAAGSPSHPSETLSPRGNVPLG
jgi:hypothetical protein